MINKFILLLSSYFSNGIFSWKIKQAKSRIVYKIFLLSKNTLLPTARAQTIKNRPDRLTPQGRLSKDGKQRFGLNLEDVMQLLPTPRSCSAISATITSESAHAPNRFPNLETVIGRAILPTPTTRDYKGARKPETLAKTGRNPNTNSLGDALINTNHTLKLQPTFVEWLMGYPKDWTKLS